MLNADYKSIFVCNHLKSSTPALVYAYVLAYPFTQCLTHL